MRRGSRAAYEKGRDWMPERPGPEQQGGALGTEGLSEGGRGD